MIFRQSGCVTCFDAKILLGAYLSPISCSMPFYRSVYILKKKLENSLKSFKENLNFVPQYRGKYRFLWITSLIGASSLSLNNCKEAAASSSRKLMGSLKKKNKMMTSVHRDIESCQLATARCVKLWSLNSNLFFMEPHKMTKFTYRSSLSSNI